MINTGVMPPIQWRTVTIDLTIAQVEALEKKQHERFEVVSLEYAYEREAEHE
uniref:Uncharacterized protein n=1 Tax=viral metagenome TaxID=1070528 RepID=A0A6H2A622_9ZZZZ